MVGIYFGQRTIGAYNQQAKAFTAFFQCRLHRLRLWPVRQTNVSSKRLFRTITMFYANSFQKLGKPITTFTLGFINLSSTLRMNEILSLVFSTKIYVY